MAVFKISSATAGLLASCLEIGFEGAEDFTDVGDGDQVVEITGLLRALSKEDHDEIWLELPDPEDEDDEGDEENASPTPSDYMSFTASVSNPD